MYLATFVNRKQIWIILRFFFVVDQNKYANAINLKHKTNVYEIPKLHIYQNNCFYSYFYFTILILEIYYVFSEIQFIKAH